MASAPGKIFVFGEHAIVYGKTAVAAAVSDLRVVTTAVRAFDTVPRFSKDYGEFGLLSRDFSSSSDTYNTLARSVT